MVQAYRMPNTGKKSATILDHGGNFHRHGSVNADREWNLGLTERVMQAERIKSLQDGKEKEPIRCPKCSMIRASGVTCQGCGYRSTRSSRMVVQQDGTLVEHTGDIYVPRESRCEDDTIKKWKQCYWRCKKTGRTFAQAEALFKWENNYNVPRDIPLMPLNELDRYLKIKDVEFCRLVSDIKPQTSDECSGSLYE